MKLWYLSFVAKDIFQGACVVYGSDLRDAIRTAWRLKINPGGQVLGMLVPADKKDLLPINCLMTRQELERYGPIMKRGDMENPPQELGLN